MKKLNWPILLGVFLVSLSVLALETILNRMFALTFWYHFAFIILSIALFGIGFGAILVFFTNRFIKDRVPIVLSVITVLLALSIPLILLYINTIPLEMGRLDSTMSTPEVFRAQQKYFGNFFLVLVIPFIFAGYIFSAIFSNYSEDINKIYFFDLLGGGIGCFFALMIFPHNGPLVTSVVISGLVIIAAALFAFRHKAWMAIPVVLLLSVVVFAIYPQVKGVDIRISEEKRDLDKLGVKLYADWDNFGYVALHEKTNGSKVVTADYTCFTYLFDSIRNPKDLTITGSWFSHYYPFAIRKNPEDVGIVGVGAGKDILLALKCGAKNVYGAEFNSTIYDIYKKKLTSVSKLSNVHIEFQEGRFFVRSSSRKYDVMIFDNSISQVAVSSGSFTMAESYLFTVEAMMDYINHMKTGGLLYLSNPSIHAQRFASVFREAFRRLGRSREFTKSIVITEEPSTGYPKCKVMVKNGTYTAEEINKILTYAASAGHVVLYAPYMKSQDVVSTIIRTDDINHEYIVNESDIRPSTDDWPYFSQHVKPESLNFNASIYKAKQFYPQPFLMLRQITGQVALYSVLFMILPLLFLNLGGLRKLQNKAGSLIYFAALGLGFMLMEVVMMQKYTLILGHPTYSFSVVLSTLLISSGVGSFLSEKIKNPHRAILYGAGGIVVTTVLTYLITLLFTQQLIGLPLVMRIISVIILVAGTGIFMGFMMPSGIRAISSITNSIPWMWAINGIFSVVASFIAVNISILYGFSAVFAIGMLVYMIGSFFFIFRFKLRGEE